MGLPFNLGELFTKITIDGRGFDRAADISVCSHENEDHEDIEVNVLYIPGFRRFSKKFAEEDEWELSSLGVSIDDFGDEPEEIVEGLTVKEGYIKDSHSALVTLGYKGANILCVGDLDMGDEVMLDWYVSRKHSKLQAVILPYHGAVKPPTHGNDGPFDVQKMEERLDRQFRRMGLAVYFMQHFNELPRHKLEKIEKRLIPKIHSTLLDRRIELARRKDEEPALGESEGDSGAG